MKTKKEKSIILKVLYMVFEVLIGGSIFASITSILPLLIFSTSKSQGFMWSFFFVYTLSFILFTYLGIAYMGRKWIIHSQDIKIIPPIIGLVVIGAAQINFENIIISIVIGLIVAIMAALFLNKMLKSAANTNQPPIQ